MISEQTFVLEPVSWSTEWTSQQSNVIDQEPNNQRRPVHSYHPSFINVNNKKVI
jgi:hypothetical protein